MDSYQAWTPNWLSPIRLNKARTDGSEIMKRTLAGTLLLAMLSSLRPIGAEEPKTRPWGRMEEMTPDDLEAVIARTPVAFVPLGTFEHHGYHLPVCFDGINAHVLCQRTAARTGGVVLPAFFYGTGGGHVGYKWTIILPEEQIRPILEATLDHLARFGFKVVVVLTGHYPKEQVDMAHRLAEEAANRNPGTHYIGLSIPELTTPLPGDTRRGDHAAKYETSIALALNPAWVKMENLRPGRDPDQVTTAATPRSERPTHDPTHPLYAIHGDDPRVAASAENGKLLVDGIIEQLSAKVNAALAAPASIPASPTP